MSFADSSLQPAVGQHPTGVHPRAPADHDDDAQAPAGLTRSPVMHSLKESGRPRRERIGAHRNEDHRHRDPQHRLPSNLHLLDHLSYRQLRGTAVASEQLTLARGFTQRGDPQRRQQPGRAHQQEGESPGSERAENGHGDCRDVRREVDHHASHDQREPRAEENAHRVNAQRAPQAFLREIIGNHRERAGSQSGLADAHAHARQKQRPEAACPGAQRGREAPEEHAHRYQIPAVARIRNAAERQSEKRVEQRERQPLQQADACIAQPKIALDGRNQQA